MIRIFQRRTNCIGCNACVELNKDRWRMSRKDGKSTLIGSMLQHEIYRVDIHDDDEYNLHMKTAMNCPMKIIKVELVR